MGSANGRIQSGENRTWGVRGVTERDNTETEKKTQKTTDTSNSFSKNGLERASGKKQGSTGFYLTSLSASCRKAAAVILPNGEILELGCKCESEVFNSSSLSLPRSLRAAERILPEQYLL